MKRFAILYWTTLKIGPLPNFVLFFSLMCFMFVFDQTLVEHDIYTVIKLYSYLTPLKSNQGVKWYTVQNKNKNNNIFVSQMEESLQLMEKK